MGLLVLQQTLDLDDEEAIEQLAFNIQFHYALDITEESDAALYICPKTLWTMRRIAVENGLDSILFQSGTQKLASIFNVDTDKQRIDSVHIQSNMRRLARISIFSTAIHKFLKNLKRHHNALFATVENGIIEQYLTEKALTCFALVKPSQSHKSLVSSDLYRLICRFKGHKDVACMHSFKLLERILNEQCQLGDDGRITVKEPKQIPFRLAAKPPRTRMPVTVGIKARAIRSKSWRPIRTTDDKDQKAKTLNLITHVEVEQAHESDAKALIPAIESAQEMDLGPKQLLADSLYGKRRQRRKSNNQRS